VGCTKNQRQEAFHGIPTVPLSMTSGVPRGSLDVDARLGFPRTRPALSRPALHGRNSLPVLSKPQSLRAILVPPSARPALSAPCCPGTDTQETIRGLGKARRVVDLFGSNQYPSALPVVRADAWAAQPGRVPASPGAPASSSLVFSNPAALRAALPARFGRTRAGGWPGSARPARPHRWCRRA